MALVGRILRNCAASMHAACGVLAFRLGMRTTARRRFERVLVLRGADFRSYIYLGRIAFDLGDYATWRREFEHAQRTDPGRFRRLRHPLEFFEPRLAGTHFRIHRDGESFDTAGLRATWSSTRGAAQRADVTPMSGLDALFPSAGDDPIQDDLPSAQALDAEPDRGPDADRHLLAGPTAGGLPDASLNRDDCGSSAERQRFRERGPIRRHEIRSCDLDDLVRRLSG